MHISYWIKPIVFIAALVQSAQPIGIPICRDIFFISRLGKVGGFNTFFF